MLLDSQSLLQLALEATIAIDYHRGRYNQDVVCERAPSLQLAVAIHGGKQHAKPHVLPLQWSFCVHSWLRCLNNSLHYCCARFQASWAAGRQALRSKVSVAAAATSMHHEMQLTQVRRRAG